MKRIYDIHCHILPGVDDGSKDMDMTVAMLEIANKEGITDMIATPHFKRGHIENEPEKLRELKDKVQKKASKINPQMRIYLGEELFNSHVLEKRLEEGTVLSMCGSRYILVEFLPNRSFKEIKEFFMEIQLSGYWPIIAHIERYECFLKNPDLAYELADIGVYIQVNTASVTGKNGFKTKHFVHKLLKDEMVDFLGTDAHNDEGRSPQMAKALKKIEKKYGQDYADLLSSYNPEKIVEGIKI